MQLECKQGKIYSELISQLSDLQVCESCREYAAAEVNNVRLLAEEEMESLGLKLEQFEREAMYELEELQTELLEARADNEGLQQRLSESEHNRCGLNYSSPSQFCRLTTYCHAQEWILSPTPLLSSPDHASCFEPSNSMESPGSSMVWLDIPSN